MLSSALFQKSSGSVVIFKWYLLQIYALGIFSRISRTSNFSILRRNNKEIWPFYQQKSNILHTYLDPVATYLFIFAQTSYLANLSDGESQLIVCGLQMTSYNGLLMLTAASWFRAWISTVLDVKALLANYSGAWYLYDSIAIRQNYNFYMLPTIWHEIVSWFLTISQDFPGFAQHDQ